MRIETWSKDIKKKSQPWKVDFYYGAKGKKEHNHKTLSGALIVDEKIAGGNTYYHRENDKVLVNLDENGKNLI